MGLRTRRGPGAGLRRPGGFTLIELLTVLAVLAIITTVAAPGMSSFAAGQRVRAMALDLNSDLLLARNEALKRNVSVTLTPNDGSWGAGWTVTAEGATVASRNASGADLRFDGAPAAVTFNVHGRVSAPTASVRITVRDGGDDNVSQRCVELDVAGRARTKTGACT